MKNKIKSIKSIWFFILLNSLVFNLNILSQDNSYTILKINTNDSINLKYPTFGNVPSFKFEINNSEIVMIEIFKITNDNYEELVSFTLKDLELGKYFFVWNNRPENLNGEFFYQLIIDGNTIDKRIFKIN